MDFSNERYVRLYVRDSTTWLRLGWDGQCVLMHLLRKADRSGVIDLGGVEPWEAAVIHCHAPEDVARRGVARVLELGCAVHDDDRLVFPRYIVANETAQSDAQRVREHREREKIKRATLKRNVTSSSNETLQNDNAEQRGVTIGNSVPCRTVPSVPEEELRPPPARDGSEVSIGHDLLVNATGIPYPPSDWRRELERIGLKPELERTAVLAAIRGDPWCRANKLAVDPTHVLKQWGKYAAGNPQLKSVVRSKFAGPSEVPTNPQDYAVNGDIKW